MDSALSDASYIWKGFASTLFKAARRIFFKSRIKNMSTRLSKNRDALASLTNTRYVLSPWYRCSNIPQKLNIYTGSSKSKLTPLYRKNGSFSTTGNNEQTGGLTGEFIVFEKLAAASREKGSPLANARLCNNLYLPLHNNPNGKIKGETDIVILTRSVAIVCEVKRWHAAIRYTPHLQTISSQRSQGESPLMYGYKDNDKPLMQAKDRWKDFKWLEHYPKDRVFYALIFANPTKFESPLNQFIDSCLVTSCDEENGTLMLDALSEVVSKYDSLFEQSDVDAIALDLQAQKTPKKTHKAQRQQMKNELFEEYLQDYMSGTTGT